MAKKEKKLCKKCKEEINGAAKKCPHCGAKQGISKWFVILAVILIIIIATAAGSSDNDNSSDTSSTSPEKVEKFSHTIDKSYSDDIGFAYYIEGTVTNNKDKEYSYVQIEFVCYDKDGNNLGTALDNTNNLLGNETWKYKAMGMFSDGGEVDHCDFKEVTGW